MKKVLALILALVFATSCVAIFASAESFTCIACGKVFSDAAAYNSHASNCQGIQCPTCQKYVYASKYDEHVKTCGMTACTYCGKYFDDEAITNHEEKCPSNPENKETLEPIVCSNCGKTFYGTDSYNEHILTCTAPEGDVINCPYCSQKFDSLEAYNKHVDSAHYNFQDRITRHFDKYVLGLELNLDTNSFSSLPRVFGYFFDMLTTTGIFSSFQEFASTGIAFFFDCLATLFQMNVVDA